LRSTVQIRSPLTNSDTLTSDVRDDEGKTSAFGARRSIELALNTALNAGNLIFLTGAGSSFSAKTAGGAPAPGMADLWDAGGRYP
jgi:hypothetical protein